MSDEDDQYDAFCDLFKAIKRSNMMREKFPDLLTAVEAMPDGRYKRNAFSTLLSAIEGTDLVRDKFDDLLTAVENMPDDRDKLSVFQDLISAIKGTNLMDDFSLWLKRIQLFQNNLAFPLLERLMEVGDPDAKKQLKVEIIKWFMSYNTDVMEYVCRMQYLKKYFTEEGGIELLLQAIDNFPENGTYHHFHLILEQAKEINFIKDNYFAFLKMIHNLTDYDKVLAIYDLFQLIKFTELVKIHFSPAEIKLLSRLDDLKHLFDNLFYEEEEKRGYISLYVDLDFIKEDSDEIDYMFRCQSWTIFEDVLEVAQKTGLLEEYFPVLIESISDVFESYQPQNAYFHLFQLAKEERWFRENYPKLMEGHWPNHDAFSALISTIEGTDLMREKFGDLLTVVETMPDNEKKLIKIEMFTKLINTIAISFKKKFTIRETILHQYFYQCCKAYPKNIILIGNFVFFLVNSRDYFHAKHFLPLMRRQLKTKKLFIFREETTLLRLLYNFFPDPHIHDIRVYRNGPSGKKIITVEFLSFVDRGIAIGCRGEYIKAVNLLFAKNLSFGKDIGFQVNIKCEDINSRGKIS